jgi:hypothetical protein
MGITNLTYTLAKRYAGLSGKVFKLRRRIAEAERVHSTLPELRTQVAKKQDELVQIAAVMHQVDPRWGPKSVKPTGGRDTRRQKCITIMRQRGPAGRSVAAVTRTIVRRALHPAARLGAEDLFGLSRRLQTAEPSLRGGPDRPHQ